MYKKRYCVEKVVPKFIRIGDTKVGVIKTQHSLSEKEFDYLEKQLLEVFPDFQFLIITNNADIKLGELAMAKVARIHRQIHTYFPDK